MSFGSVRKKKNGGRAKPKNYKLLIFRMDDVQTFPTRGTDGVTATTALELKVGANAIELEVTADSIGINQGTSGDTDAKGYKQEIKCSRPGSDDAEWEQFANENVNEELGCIVRHCRPGVPHKLFGTPCNPLSMDVNTIDDKDKDVNEVTLATNILGDRAMIYNQTVPAIDSQSSGSGSIA